MNSVRILTQKHVLCRALEIHFHGCYKDLVMHLIEEKCLSFCKLGHLNKGEDFKAVYASHNID